VYSYRHKGTHYGSLEDRRQGNPPTTNNTHAPSSTLNITVLADEDDYDCLGRMRVDRPDLDPIYYIEPILYAFLFFFFLFVCLFECLPW